MKFRIGYHALHRGIVLHSFEVVAFLQRFFGRLDRFRPIAQEVVGARRVLEDVRIVRREDKRSLQMA